MLDIKVGGIYKVIESGQIYSTYPKFAIDAGHDDIATTPYVNTGESYIVQDKKVRVLYIGTHEKYPDKTLAIVETVNKSKYLKFIIDNKGLGTTKEMMIDMFIEEYFSGKPITEKILNKDVSKQLIKAIIFKAPMDIQFVSEKLVTDEEYASILKKDGGLLGIIPEARRTLELCRLAVKEEPYATRFIPEKLKSLVNS